jgi:uncharacterized protein (TIGR03437 family)
VPSSGNVARGELISIYGSNLTSGTTTLAPFPPVAPLSLAGTSVTIGGLAAPILFISPTQLNVQVPFEIAAGVPSVNVTVTVGTLASTPFLAGVSTSDLGLFSAQGVIAPSSLNTAAVSTTPGATIVLAATGLGAISPAVASGTIPVPGTSAALAIPPVTMNGALAVVLSATYDGLGIYTIKATVPLSADTGLVTVVLGGSGGAAGPPGPTGATGATGPAGATGQAGATGPAGATGSQGLPGFPGGQGPAGQIGATGATGSLSQVTLYGGTATYGLGAVVFYMGSAYQSSANGNLGNLPTNGSPWTLLAQQGATGAAGPTGAAGVVGPTGATGANVRQALLARSAGPEPWDHPVPTVRREPWDLLECRVQPALREPMGSMAHQARLVRQARRVRRVA